MSGQPDSIDPEVHDPGKFGEEQLDELRSIVEDLRVTIHRIVEVRPPLAALRRLSEKSRSLADFISQFPVEKPIPLFGSPRPDVNGLLPYSPFSGRFNPIAPPIELRYADGRVHGETVFASAYEGPPGMVHGGVLAGVFDQLAGVTSIVNGTAGPTLGLSVKQKTPAPLNVNLEFESWVERVEGRRVIIQGTCHRGDTLVAEFESPILHSYDLPKQYTLAE